MTRTAFLLAIPTVLIFTALACSKSPPAASKAPPASEAPSPKLPEPEPQPQPAAQTKPECKLLDLAMLRDALGAPALELDSERGNGTVLQCRYVAPGGRPSVLIQIQRDAKREYFDAARQASFGDSATTVEGLGDAAYTVKQGEQTSLVVLAGDRSIQLSGSFDPDHLRTLIDKLLETKPF